MLALDTVPALRGAGNCVRCHHRVPGPLHRGQKSYVCEITGLRTPGNQDACIDYVVSQVAKSASARYSANERQRRKLLVPKRIRDNWTDPPPPKVVLVTLDRCRHCGSTTLWRDPDGWGCMQCGWHLWSSASERLYGERPIGDAMPSLCGVLSNEW